MICHTSYLWHYLDLVMLSRFHIQLEVWFQYICNQSKICRIYLFISIWLIRITHDKFAQKMESFMKTKSTSPISILHKRGNTGNGLSGKLTYVRGNLFGWCTISNKILPGKAPAKWHNSLLPMSISRVKNSISIANQIWSDDISK